MLIIPIKDGENIDRALKRFKRKFDKTGTKKSLQTRKEFSTKFWEDIKEMGGVVSLTEGECEVEMSSLINSSLVKIK